MVPSRASGSSSSRPPRRSRATVPSYNEATSEEDSDFRTSATTRPRRQPAVSLRSRSATQRPSYRESSDYESSTVEEPGEESEEAPAHERNVSVEIRGNTRPSINRRMANRPQTSSGRQRPSGNKRRPRDRPSRAISHPAKKAKYYSELLDDTTRVIPPWQTLPYHILFDILLHATYPEPNEKWEARSDMARWLVNVACLCRAFQEPALAALYYCPPLFPSYKCHALVNLLSMPRESLLINYAGKIKELLVDVDVLRYKSGPILGYFDLAQLIQKIPQVHIVRLYHQEDFILGHQPWNVPLSKWMYSEHLFEVMDSTGVRLHAWDWNSRFLDLPDLLPFMLKQHQRPAFQRLREVKLHHLGDRNRQDTSEKEDSLASALKVLPALERLELVECTLLTDRLLLQLPSTLCSLTITNCDRLFTPYLDAFLKSHGSSVRELNLNHNRHLDLFWTDSLAEHCPNLEKLKFDGTIYDASPHNDTNPHFDALLNPDVEPTWPRTLREIEMTCLRRLDGDCAELFLNSLQHAASEMCSLRRLVVSMILNVSWRDRARFRDTWVPQITRTFRRSDFAQSSPERSPFPESSAAPKRHSARLVGKKGAHAESAVDAPVYAPCETSPSAQPQQHGMCDEVLIRIDNQRPSETQFNENDFLDSEASGDDDWPGGD
ncbi:hypothetical protein N7532_004674 [Penicillium argentinense]|uniref:Uncharacterized protein n=1 Tax=Penicillium argentinense TaxID=1131581 RepID=A0A9W9KF37_9EURO|nr:uncharacterized protein N7532_004674 [Penicillium argentinense]KAJ5104145.1 hypothetical protein N7532_004674 [Penicillium argentinense]